MHDEEERGITAAMPKALYSQSPRRRRIEVAARFEATGVSVGFEKVYHELSESPLVSAIEIIEVPLVRVSVAQQRPTLRAGYQERKFRDPIQWSWTTREKHAGQVLAGCHKAEWQCNQSGQGGLIRNLGRLGGSSDHYGQCRTRLESLTRS